ncbi:MAG TPA: phosphoribosylformylglycinamidine synthase subunit PurQ [Candidatus Mcinerneyibacteriales bacterium]|nr:phosphoribosylformylglycinamidine synthase subunit PurQ [Candidatus Mcinerneyibacteriales bacterium]
MAARPHILIITGYGLNCQEESAAAFRMAGAGTVELIHLNDLISAPEKLGEAHLLMLIGGFSYGDHIAAGRAFAARLKHTLSQPFSSFVREGGLILGVCNGFQILMKLGLLPATEGVIFSQTATITENICGHFYDGWVNLKVNPGSPCIYTRGIDRLYLPARHGEGRILFRDEAVFQEIKKNGQDVLHYTGPDGNPTEEFPYNPNGTAGGLAGLCDTTGRIFGLMPHPEAHILPWTHPLALTRARIGEIPGKGEGLAIFINAVDFIRRHL